MGAGFVQVFRPHKQKTRIYMIQRRTSIQTAAPSTLSLDNDLLLEAIPSRPDFHHLELADLHLRPPTAIFHGLFAALRLCPHLHTLHVSVDAVNFDIDPEAESFQHTSLLNFDVCPSDVADAEVVARFMLPRVNQVSYQRILAAVSHEQPR
ncbi:hypothetical protein DFH29DRAFT_295466 [Suillus ampliporus]|nr:hypothetical protein DFH29DRAFT_295466 [Suillus ampliporus]